MNITAAQIAHTLNANITPISLVMDMADTLEDTNIISSLTARNEFIVASTLIIARGLRMDLRAVEAASKS